MIKKSIIIAAILLTACLVGNAYATIPAEERNALIELYNSTNGANWTNNTNWLGEPGTECTWYGVICDAGNNHVTNLHLWQNQLTGSLPSSLENLSNLKILNLTENQLTGSIPATFENLFNLENLALGNNQLTGIIPDWIGSMQNLNQIYLWQNQLTGNISHSLGNLSNLMYIELSDNYLTGDIPQEIGNLSQLRVLNFTRNQLAGSIPATFENLFNLENLALGGNQLTGVIPDWIGNLQNLTYLYLWGNLLTENIPITIGNLTNLMDLQLSENQLSGIIPTTLGNLTNLTVLSLHSNQLTGNIPSEIGNLTNLRDLRLSFNQLTGEIPVTLGNLTNLEIIYLCNNQLTGAIPPELGNLTNLIHLQLCENQLTGNIPVSLGNLSNLKTLYLYMNQLTGTVPASLGNLLNLEELYLYVNQLTGDIPAELGNLISLKRLSLGDNHLAGRIPASIGNLLNLEALYLWDNQLSGEIPPEIINLTNLIVGQLNIRYNMLSSSDPDLINFLNSRQINGDWESTQFFFTVDASFSAFPVFGKPPLTVVFSDRSSGYPSSWKWDFNNDGVTDSTEQNPSFTYDKAGIYSVRLVAENRDYSDDIIAEDYIEVTNFRADFTADGIRGNAPFTVQFTDQSFGSPTSWQWDFNNDGITDSTEQHPTYTYNSEGTYTVKLTVSNGDATDVEVKNDYIEVLDTYLNADFNTDKTFGKPPLTVQFTDKSAGPPTSWQWDFDNDGNIDSTEQNPQYTYDSEGIYSVKLTVSDGSFSVEKIKENLIQVTNTLPDFQVSDIQLSQAYAGQSFQITWTVENTGDSATTIPIWKDKVYLSPSAVFDEQTAQLLIDSSRNTALQPGESYTKTATHTFPVDESGEYYVFVFTDAPDMQPEKEEGNNSKSSSVFSVQPSPASNLLAGDIRSPLSVFSRAETQISWMVKNTGDWNISGQWTDRLYLSTDTIPDAADILLAEFSRSEGLSSGSDYLQKETLIMPEMESGSYYLILETDSSGSISETAEDDNIRTRPVTYAKAKHLTASPDRIMLNLTSGLPVSGQIDITNLGNTAMSGITAAILNASPNIDIQLDTPSGLESMASGKVSYTVRANDESFLENETTVLFTGNGDDEAAVIFETAVIPAKPRLAVNPGYLESGMLHGQQRTVECEITNTGGAPANDLMVMLPNADWLTLVTPETIGTLAQGEKAKIGIALNPSADMNLGPYTGAIAVSGSNAKERIGFRFTAVSEAKGGLKIIAKDEFSYFADNHPNVAGAEVSLKDAYGDTVIAEGLTDENGVFTLQNINEGKYELTVRADKHATYHAPIDIVPGVEKEVEAFMARQLVTYNWSVVPIDIEDNYKITLEAVFETHVPAPVITVEPANMLVPLDEGEITTVELTVTNHGLIAVNDVTINFPEYESVYIKPTIEKIGVLPAMTSVTIPVLVRDKEYGPIEGQSVSAKRTGTKRSASNALMDKCPPVAEVQYYIICGGVKYYAVSFDWRYIRKVREIINKANEAVSNAVGAANAIQKLIDIIEDLEDGSINEETVNSISLLFGINFIIDPIKNEWVLDNSGDISEFSGGSSGSLELIHYKISDSCLSILKDDGVPEDILSKLEIIKDIEYTGRYYFINALESVIEKEQSEQYKLLILECAEITSNIIQRAKRGGKSLLVNADSAVKLCEMLPGLCEKAVEPICNYSPNTCKNITDFIDKNENTLELLKIALHTAKGIISVGADMALCATIFVGDPLGIVGCLSFACDIISLNNNLGDLVTELNERCISEIPIYYFYPVPISVPLPECVPIQIPDVPKIETDPCICGLLSLFKFGINPSVSSGVSGMAGLLKCMCKTGGSGGSGGDSTGGIWRPVGGGSGTFTPCTP